MRFLAVALLKALWFVVPVLPPPVLRVLRRRLEAWERHIEELR